MLRLLAAVSVAAFVLAASPAAACGPITHAVNVEAPDREVVVERSPDPAAAAWPKTVAITPGGTVFGLTAVEVQTAVAARMRMQRQGGVVCLLHIDFDVRFPFQGPIRVTMRSSLDQGSCAWRVTYDHEMQHVEIAKEARRIALAQAQEEIRAWFHQITAANASETAIREMLDRYTRWIGQRMHDRYKAVSEGWNRTLDSPDSYRALQQQCRDWRR